MPSIAAGTHPLTDLSLARRLERTEAVANAAFVEARAQLEPSVGAAWIDLAGVYAMFDGPESPITQTFGLGLFDDLGEAELGDIEAFFRDRGAPTCHEVSPLIPAGVLDLLNVRGYRPQPGSGSQRNAERPAKAGTGDGAGEDRAYGARLVTEAELPCWTELAYELRR